MKTLKTVQSSQHIQCDMVTLNKASSSIKVCKHPKRSKLDIPPHNSFHFSEDLHAILEVVFVNMNLFDKMSIYISWPNDFYSATKLKSKLYSREVHKLQNTKSESQASIWNTHKLEM